MKVTTGAAVSIAAATVMLGLPTTAFAQPASADLVHVALDDAGLSVSASDGDDGYDLTDLTLLAAPVEQLWAVAPEEPLGLPGIDTGDIAAGELTDDELTISVLGVAGPGEFAVYAGGEPILSGDVSLTVAASDRIDETLWTVSEPGEHHVELLIEAQTVDGDPLSATADLLFETTEAPTADVPGLSAGWRGGDESPADEEATTYADPKVFDDGHIDMGPRFVDGTWTVQIRDDTVSPPEWLNLSDAVLHVLDNAVIEVPAGDAHAFLGEPGDEVWMLPQAQQSGIVWPGWNTQDPSVVEEISGAVTWNLVDVDGPGVFALFLTGSFGTPEVLFDSGQALPQSLSIPLNTHAHGNWAFTQAGVYHLTVEFTATTASGSTVSDTKVLGVAVGDDTDPGSAVGGEPGANPGGDNGDGAGPQLPTTGAPIGTVAAGGAAMVGAGGVAWLVSRRRKAEAAPTSAGG